MPRLFGPNYSNIAPLCITDPGIIKLLKVLNVNKAAGPDSIACRVLRELADELGPVLTLLFRQSVQEGILPSEWKTAFVTPIFKKGRLNQPSNYRPVSLTCVCCKLLEHVICKHIMLHLESHGGQTAALRYPGKCSFMDHRLLLRQNSDRDCFLVHTLNGRT